ncbi:MAG: hypothetical protein AABY18_09535 [Candidatus Thermoplasmatota archaeon]
MRAGIPDAIEGTRGLLLGTALLLVAAMLEPALPATFPRWLFTIPALTLLVTGLCTLPREGLAAQERALTLAEAGEWRHILARIPWLAVAVVLLLPRLFLGAYGIPHLNPLVGLVPQQWVVRLATVFLFVVLLVPILYLRAGRHGAVWPRQSDLHEGDPKLRRRDTLLVGVAAMLVVWALLLEPFWAPFSLLQWPPQLWSLAAGSRGVAALAFALLPPVVLFMALSAQVALARRLLHQPRTPARDRCIAAAGAHLLFILTAAFLHGYDLLWIARYESLAQF